MAKKTPRPNQHSGTPNFFYADDFTMAALKKITLAAHGNKTKAICQAIVEAASRWQAPITAADAAEQAR